MATCISESNLKESTAVIMHITDQCHGHHDNLTEMINMSSNICTVIHYL